jgi:aminopeptidase N
VALRTFARTAGDPDEVAWLRAEAGDDVDLHWRALVREAELGGDVEAEVERLRERDPDPDAWVRAVAVRAARPSAEEKAAVWHTLVEERAVPIGSVSQVTTAFWRPGQDDVLRPFAERFVDLVPDLHRGGMTPAMVFASRLFPVYAVSEAFLDRALAVGETAAPVVRKTLTERADLVRRMLRSRQQ